MKIRILIDPASNFNSLVIDTDSLSFSCVDCATGRILLFPAPEGSSFCKESLPTLFISEIINDLINYN